MIVAVIFERGPSGAEKIVSSLQPPATFEGVALPERLDSNNYIAELPERLSLVDHR